jgi:hypothetical protein
MFQSPVWLRKAICLPSIEYGTRCELRDWSLSLFAAIVVLIEFEPHSIEDPERAGKTQAEDPRKIPHAFVPRLQ